MDSAYSRINATQKKLEKVIKEKSTAVAAVQKTVKNRSSSSTLVKPELLVKCVGDSMVNQVAPSIENAMNEVFSGFIDSYGEEMKEVNSKMESLRSGFDEFYEEVKKNSQNSMQKSMIQELLKNGKICEAIQSVINSKSEEGVKLLIRSYDSSWIDEVNDHSLLVEFANLVILMFIDDC